MRHPTSTLVRSFASLTLIGSVVAGLLPAQDWPHWRGPEYDGSTTVTGLPTTFSKTENVRWQTAMPGPGASTPIVVGDRIYLTSVDSERERLVAMCLDRKSGEVVWQHDAGSGYKEREGATRIARGSRTRATFACPSAVTDGERVVFFFGNGDLVAYHCQGEDDGAEAWRRNVQADYGNFAFNWTFSASPTYHDGLVYLPVLQRDEPIQRRRRGGRGRRGPQDGGADGEQPAEVKPPAIDSFLLAMDPATGKTVFKHVRPSPAKVESLESYTSLIPYTDADGNAQLLLAGGDVLTGHDPKTGAELWRWGTWNEGHRERFWRLVPSVVTGSGMALVCAPKRAPVYAIQLGGKGELPKEACAWQSEGRPNPVSSDVPTPAFEGGAFYVLSDVRAALSKVDARTGKVQWTTNLPKEHLWRGSPTVADGKVYCMNHNGLVVVADCDTGEIAHQVAMGDEDDDHTRSTIVAAHGALFIRTNSTLYCLAQ